MFFFIKVKRMLNLAGCSLGIYEVPERGTSDRIPIDCGFLKKNFRNNGLSDARSGKYVQISYTVYEDNAKYFFYLSSVSLIETIPHGRLFQGLSVC